MPLATENLYLSAYVLTNGALLSRVLVSRTNGRKTAVFELEGPWVQRLSDEYFSGTACVNLAEYRRHLEALKDELFTALNRDETETERRRHAPHRKGRARDAEAPR